MAVDTSNLAPRDAAVAARTMPRRFTAALRRPTDRDDVDATDTDPDEIARRIGPDGTAAIDRLLTADGLFALTTRALTDVRTTGAATGHAALVRPDERDWQDPHTPLTALLDQFAATCTEFAAAIEALDNEDWNVDVTVAGVGPVNVLTIVQHAVGDAGDLVAAAQRTMHAAVRTR